MCGFLLSSSSMTTIRGLVAATAILLELRVFTLSRFNDLPVRREVRWMEVRSGKLLNLDNEDNEQMNIQPFTWGSLSCESTAVWSPRLYSSHSSIQTVSNPSQTLKRPLSPTHSSHLSSILIF
ncbi:hypothetical protein L2E82_46910 [Cichorium intybus]|uniref:Uncharacterized protein n=1 Tax=Cichorium intybus TaxID=13427 RepID=A0ACB8YTA7_CICIN|nr:hypothetical protein L2E82_46910 [Cichorium intybus]